MRQFNQQLRQLRKAKNLSRKTLAENLNISYVALSKYETGERFPDISTLIDLARYFQVSLDYLFGTQTSKLYEIDSELKEIVSILQELTKDQREIALEYVKLIKKLDLKKNETVREKL